MMDVDSLNMTLDLVAKEMDLPRDVLVKAIEDAIETAAHKVFGSSASSRPTTTPRSGRSTSWQFMEVVEEIETKDREITLDQAKLVDPDAEVGDELGFQIFYLEKDKDKAEEEDRKHGDILGIKQARATSAASPRRPPSRSSSSVCARPSEAKSSTSTRTARASSSPVAPAASSAATSSSRCRGPKASCPSREQMHRESYRAGDRVQAYVKEVRSDSRGPQIILSRTDPGLIYKLFEMEVPEIYEGIVRIVAVAREPGERTKIAVAFAGPRRRSRGRLRRHQGQPRAGRGAGAQGRKDRHRPFSEDIAKFVCNAIAPGRGRARAHRRAQRDHRAHRARRPALAGHRSPRPERASREPARGWKIDIHPESKIEEFKDELRYFLTPAHAELDRRTGRVHVQARLPLGGEHHQRRRERDSPECPTSTRTADAAPGHVRGPRSRPERPASSGRPAAVRGGDAASAERMRRSLPRRVEARHAAAKLDFRPADST
jgi:N utilization substance protein A